MMIIIEDAESNLLKMIGDYRRMSKGHRSLYFRFSKLGIAIDTWLAPFSDALKMVEDSGHLSSVYICNDQDAFVFAQGVTHKSLDKIMSYIGTHIDLSSTDNIASLFDVKMDAAIIEALCHKKISTLQKIKFQQEQKDHEKLESELREKSFANIDPHKIATLTFRKKRHAAPQIMIADDDPMLRALIKNILEPDFNVVYSKNGQAAVLDFADVAPHVMFLDINLPDMNGHEVLKRILQIDPNAYIVMLSGEKDSQNILKALELGAKGFISKPFTRKKIFQYIEKSSFYETE